MVVIFLCLGRVQYNNGLTVSFLIKKEPNGLTIPLSWRDKNSFISSPKFSSDFWVKAWTKT